MNYSNTNTHLRDYQIRQLNWLLSQLKEKHNPCIQSPTGTGKGELIKAHIQHNINEGLRTLILTPRRELCTNLSQRMPGVTTLAYNGSKPDLTKPVLISTFLSAAKYVKDYVPHQIISDECHLSVSNQWLNAVKQARLAAKEQGFTLCHTGYSATPNRLDGTGLHLNFNKLYTSEPIKWFIERGYLSPYQIYRFDSPEFCESTDNLSIQEKIFMPEVKRLVDAYEEAGKGKAIAFSVTIDHGKAIEAEFSERGYRAKFLSSKSHDTERDIYFAKYKNNEIEVLINVDLFSLGVDIPDCDMVILGRFTYSTAKYLQMIGRCLRPFPDKVAKIIDMVNVTHYHGTPSFPFDWSLAGQTVRASGNKESVIYRCCECDTDLFHKKYIPKGKVNDFIEVYCLNCKTLNTVFCATVSKTGSRKNIMEEFVSIEDLRVIKNETKANFTALLNRKEDQKKKLPKILQFQGIDDTIKRRALLHIGFTEKQIAIYFD